jgi:hypothetical protein
MMSTVQLESVLSLISRVAGREAVWVVGGSAGLLLRGLSLEKSPRDLDLYADEADALHIHHALAPYAVDRQEESITERYRSILSHYEIGGMSVELVGGFEVHAHDSLYKLEVRELLMPLGLKLQGTEDQVAVVPLAHELWFNLLRDRPDRLRQIGAEMKAHPQLHLPAFEQIVERNVLATVQIELAYSWIGGKRAEERV